MYIYIGWLKLCRLFAHKCRSILIISISLAPSNRFQQLEHFQQNCLFETGLARIFARCLQGLVQGLVQPRSIEPWMSFLERLQDRMHHHMMFRQKAFERSHHLKMQQNVMQCLLESTHAQIIRRAYIYIYIDIKI